MLGTLLSLAGMSGVAFDAGTFGDLAVHAAVHPSDLYVRRRRGTPRGSHCLPSDQDNSSAG